MKVGKFLKCLVPLIIFLGINIIVSGIMLVPKAIPFAMELAQTGDMENYMDSIMSLTTDKAYLQSATVAFQIVSFIVFALIYFLGLKAKLNTFSGHFTGLSFGSMLLLFIGLELFSSAVLMTISIAAPSLLENYEKMIEMVGLGDLSLISSIATLVLAPLVEEIAFRGITMKWAKNFTDKFWLANIIQAALFGIAHMNMVQGLYAFVLGLVLGYVRNKYKSLWASIFGHLVFNFCGTWLITLIAMTFSDTIVTALVVLACGAALAAVGFILNRKEVEYPEPVSAGVEVTEE